MTEQVVVDGRRLGKGPVKEDPRTLMLSKYVGAVTPPPASVDYLTGVPAWGMFKNDTLGDCTCATTGHYVQQWTYDAAKNEVTISDSDIVVAYSAVSGYDPQTGANDNGAVELDVLNYWHKTGVGGHKIAAFVKVTPSNHDQVKQAVNLFGGVYIGLGLPISAQNQVGSLWTVTTGADAEVGSWGGHAVHVGAYDADGPTVITWGAPQKMTWEFWDKYVDEAYAVLSEDWLNDGKDPQGLDLATLTTDLANVGKNDPNVDPTPTPTPPQPTPPTPTPPTPGPTPEPPTPSPDVDTALLEAADEWLSHHHTSHINKALVNPLQAWVDEQGGA